MGIRLFFKKDYSVNNYTKKKCDRLIKLIKKHKHPTGAFLASQMCISSQEVRELIKTIRENNSLFFKDKSKYVIAHPVGYTIVSEYKELRKYEIKLQAMTHSKVKQLNELKEVIDTKKKKGGKNGK